jgi:hypothetical protein
VLEQPLCCLPLDESAPALCLYVSQPSCTCHRITAGVNVILWQN